MLTPEERAAKLFDELEIEYSDGMNMAKRGAADTARIAAAIAEAIADEREACAKIADSYCRPENRVGRMDDATEAITIAEEIRARSIE